MKARGYRDAGNAAGFGVSTRCAGSPLRCDPSDDTPNPAAWKLAMAERGLSAMTDRLLAARPRADSRTRLTLIQPAGDDQLSRAQNQSEYALFSPSDCPTNQDHLISRGSSSFIISTKGVYDAEKADSLEFGGRFGFAGGKGQVNVTLFTTDYDNRQVTEQFDDPVTGATFFILWQTQPGEVGIFGNAVAAVSRPATYGLTLRYNFGGN